MNIDSTYEPAGSVLVFHSLVCPPCLDNTGVGRFRDLDRHAPCPVCGGETVLASTFSPVPLPERTEIPSELATDPLIAKLLGQQKALPTRIRDLERQITSELKPRCTTTAQRVGTTRVRVDAGIAEQRDLDAVVDDAAEAENELHEAERTLDSLVAARRIFGDEIMKVYDERRRAFTPQISAAARAFAAEVQPHLDAIERLATQAETYGVRFDGMFGDTSVSAHRTFAYNTAVPISVLRFLSRP